MKLIYFSCLIIALLAGYPSTASMVIKSGAVTTTKIANNAVTTAKIADAQVTQIKRSAAIAATSTSSGSFSSSSSSFVDVTNLSVTITATGSRPVMVVARTTGEPAGGNQPAEVMGFAVAYAGQAQCKIINGAGTTLSSVWFSSGTMMNSIYGMTGIDTPSSGSNTYKVQCKSTAGNTFYVTNMILTAVEL